MKNEFGEEISDEQAKQIGKRVAKLPETLIDELFYRCGLIYSRRDYSLRALHHLQLLEIRKKKEESEPLTTLLSETTIKEVLENLDRLEEEFKRVWKDYL